MKLFTIIPLLLITLGLSAQNPQEKYALVIGVKSYKFVQPLANSLNDAKDLSATLKTKGFQVIELYDPQTKRDMQDAVRRYFGLLQGKNNVAGMVFYSGHGMQVDGINYLIPATANPQLKADLDDQCLSMDYVMRAIEEAGNGLNIFVLDACRNNPFRSFSRSGEKGLTMVNAPRGSYIVYSTKPGSVASDGTGRNGLFTSKLLKHINEEGLKFEEVFKRVAADVAAESGDAQRPWISSDYTGDFYFSGDANTVAKETKQQQLQQKQPVVTKKDEPKREEQKRDEPKQNANKLLSKDLNNAPNTASAAVVGIWTNNQFGTTMTLMLNENGQGEFDGEFMKYSVKAGKITMITDNNETNVYNLSVNGDQMTFSGGDLDQPLAFTKYSSSAYSTQPESRSVDPSTSSTSSDNNSLIGVWTGNNETVEFKSNGQIIYGPQTFNYTANQGVINMQTQQGNMMFYYAFVNGQLLLTINGIQYYYNKVTTPDSNKGNANNNAGGGGKVSQELVGKWCWINITNTNSGGSTSDRCITLNADGSYFYAAGRSMSVNDPYFSGGTNSQSSDRGAWWVQGDRIYYNSQSSGQGSYRLEKRNHPKNVNDPMIVLDGQPFVTAFQKAAWR